MTEIKDAPGADSALIEEMFSAGAHYGSSRSRRHPSVAPHIYATKGGTDIIDLEKSLLSLRKAQEFLRKLGAAGKTVLLVGTKPEARSAVLAAAGNLSMPHVSVRWIGGTLTNFSEIKKRITELEEYKKGLASGEFEKLTKRERMMLAKKMEKLALYYGGLLGMKKIPDAVLIVDPRAERVAAAEALQAGVPTVALTGTRSDLQKIEHPVLGNDASVSSIGFFVGALAKAYGAGRSEAEREEGKTSA